MFIADTHSDTLFNLARGMKIDEVDITPARLHEGGVTLQTFALWSGPDGRSGDYERIARESFSSAFHFQRVFSILCGYTLGEYIRNRRLTLAGAELANTREKVIDVAYKYGYDNPESFAYV